MREFPLASEPCKGCKQRIRWMRNDATKNMAPVHTVERPDGNVVLVDTQLFHVLTKLELEDLDGTGLFPNGAGDRWADYPRYVLHFAVCPRADVYRRRDPKGRQHQ